MNWQSVATGLPPIGQEVLVYTGGVQEPRVTALCRLIRHEGASDHFWDNRYGTGNLHLSDSVTHWMPLPEPPA